ncbi:receptor-like protein 7 [Magnolia sinica]|uniref:receptor-like protein 7 n=1 Tax=Magnolia sinica TaxID=86752 RepID=UPI00265A4C7A|nr:receptor-like protein 7 [Magnolia sinica]
MALLSSINPLFLILFLLPSLVFATQQCNHHHFSALLHLKHGFNFTDSTLSTLPSWNSNNTDCCSWEGITCDGATGHVMSLDLSSLYISGRIDSESLFRLRSLRKLNLAYNEFDGSTIPSGFEQLTSLTHLNLSHLRFYGQIPLEISRLTTLVSLDLSYNGYFDGPYIENLKLENPSMGALVQNLSSLRELYLDRVDILAPGSEWGQALFLPLPRLRKLSLQNCGLSDSIYSSVSQLHFLSELDLSFNNLSSAVPSFTGRLRKLILQDCGLSGSIHYPLSQLHFLSELDLSFNNLSSTVPIFPRRLRRLILKDCGLLGSIRSSLSQLHLLSELDLSENTLSSSVPDGIGNFSSLTSLRLEGCELYGKFPESIFQLPTLQFLDISNNPLLTVYLPEFPQNNTLQQLILSSTGFSGKLPDSLNNLLFLTRLDLSSCNLSGSLPSSLCNLTKLQYLDLSNNRLYGPIPSCGNQLQNLQEIMLWNNLLNGSIPSSLFSIQSLQMLGLSINQFSGQLGEFHNASSSQLQIIYLQDNNLQGMIPRSIFQLTRVQVLDVSSNNFSGVVQIGLFQNLKKLYNLELSDNNLSIQDGGVNSTFVSTPQFALLGLRSCNISTFPNFLRNQERLGVLDLSNNKISGEIPKWIWEVGNGTLSSLNLSHNALQGIESPSPHLLSSALLYLDLSSNILEGSLPIPSPSIVFFSVSNNSLVGEIPLSVCNAIFLLVLDLSDNRFRGQIPPCLGEIGDALIVLNLQGNAFNGPLPQTFKKGCNIQTLDFSRNQLEGQVPRSLANCKMLELLNLGNNQIQDTFPLWLEALSQMRILVLRSNQFRGTIGHPLTNHSFPLLQILDLSSNSFEGKLPSNMFKSLKAMMEENKSQSSFLGKKIDDSYYQNRVSLVSKGLQMELVKILTAFTVVDLSKNKFHGDISESIGVLKSLHVLNMSNNCLTGRIPTSFENLRELESLDLSQNKLSGEIPWQLIELTFLAVLNLSHNLLIGKIPQSQQFLTFSNESFKENLGLCGPPLSRKCEDAKDTPPPALSTLKLERKYDWELMRIGFGVGHGVGVGMLFWTLALWRNGRREFYIFIDRMLSLIFPSMVFSK